MEKCPYCLAPVLDPYVCAYCGRPPRKREKPHTTLETWLRIITILYLALSLLAVPLMVGQTSLLGEKAGEINPLSLKEGRTVESQVLKDLSGISTILNFIILPVSASVILAWLFFFKKKYTTAVVFCVLFPVLVFFSSCGWLLIALWGSDL